MSYGRSLKPPPPREGSAAAEIVKLRGRLGDSDSDEDEEWLCKVCKRKNSGKAKICRVCYAPINYKDPPPPPPAPLPEAPEGLEELLLAGQEAKASAEKAKEEEREIKEKKLKDAGFNESNIEVQHENDSLNSSPPSSNASDEENLINAVAARAKKMKKKRKLKQEEQKSKHNEMNDRERFTHTQENEEKTLETSKILRETPISPADDNAIMTTPKKVSKSPTSVNSKQVESISKSLRLSSKSLRLEELDTVTPRIEKKIQRRENNDALNASIQAATTEQKCKDLQRQLHSLRLEYDQIRASNRDIETLGAPTDESAFHEAARLKSLIEKTKRDELDALRLIVRLIGQEAATELLKSGDIDKIFRGDIAPLRRLNHVYL
uniref:RanBP2-type domain-containing protein n=1 Tax=Aureoumbra lagunensis TaxID=44058 RepID=A0A7S3K3Q9_9STRA